jgi:alpha-L-fucosidase
MRRWRRTGAALALAGPALLVGAAAVAVAAEADPPRAEARRRFEGARFGLFIDWGVHTLLGKGPAVMERDRLPAREYEKLPPRFNPSAFEPEAWVKAAGDAGARYLAVTAKGPDGFCMFDSALTRFDVVDATPFAKDPLKALADACRKRRLPLVVVYWMTDWHHPDSPAGTEVRVAPDRARYVAYAQGQLRELCTRYGPLGGVWLVVGGPGEGGRPADDLDLAGACRLVHELQPSALVGVHDLGPGAGPRPGAPGPLEDVRVVDLADPALLDGLVTEEGGAEGDGSPLVEVLTPMPRPPAADARGERPPVSTAVVRLLAAAAGRGANLRLRVAARADGSLDPETTTRLAEVGRWLERAGASVYDTTRGPIPPQPWGVSTRKAGTREAHQVFLHVFHPEGPLILPGATVSLSARALGGTKPLPITRADGRAVLTIAEAERDPADTVIVLTPGVLLPEREIRR